MESKFFYSGSDLQSHGFDVKGNGYIFRETTRLKLFYPPFRKGIYSKKRTQLAFFINLQRAVIGPSATLTGR